MCGRESSAQTSDQLHAVGTAAARGGGERPVLGRGRRDSDPGGLCGWDSEALQHRGGQVPGSEALLRRGGHIPRPRPSRRLLELRVGPGVCRMRQDPARPHMVATGGKENALKVWDLQGSEEPVFRAKNVRNDWLDLRVPIWDQDIQFLPESQKLVTCTGYHQVRVYDPASPQRRPVLEATYGEYPLTAMTLTPGGNSVIVGNTHGQLAEIDLRQGRLLVCLKGLAGSVRGLQCHPSKPLLASCGLDRVLRVHRIRNPRGLDHKVYLKSQLNCLLLSGRDNWEDEPHEPQEPNKVPSEDTETDELWASLEAAAKRKLPRLEQSQGALQTRQRKKKRPGSTSS
ncbi:WD repeat-containing protein 74 isoform X3 [Delphinus delphis]|uniref:WD repeat-containing protein 74 isoform X3 n=1 Tax=Delphinus delphis TaxID=9728 RepID=UPI0028C399E1|nr:WD repeat-containing protein 74 isoform X3 [Delphinus delphis]